jgi:predicted ArsR family transcriptional regulator
MERYPGFVCSLHQQLLKGAADSFFGNVQFEELSSMSKGDSACAYSVQVTHKAGSRD